jgi:hypothetical protein
MAESLPEGKDDDVFVYSWRRHEGRFFFQGIPRQRVEDVDDVRVRVIRLQTRRTRVSAPEFRGVPEGWSPRDVKVEPATEFAISGPKGMIDDDVVADAVDVGPSFQSGEAKNGPVTIDLSFDGWRRDRDPSKAQFRADVELPEVTLTVRFVATETRSYTNALERVYISPDDRGDAYEWKVDQGLPGYDADQQRFKGEFRGGKAELDLLKERIGEWYFGYRVPADEIAKFRQEEARSREITATLAWIPTSRDLMRLNVDFVPPASHEKVRVTVTKRD